MQKHHLMSFVLLHIDPKMDCWNPDLLKAILIKRQELFDRGYTPEALEKDSADLPDISFSETLELKEMCFLYQNNLLKEFIKASPTPRSIGDQSPGTTVLNFD